MIFNEDCRKTMTGMNPHSIDAVMTSPPYNMTSRKGGMGDTGRYDEYEDWMDYDEYVGFTVGIFQQFDRVVKENGVVLYNFGYSIENPSFPYRLVNEIVDNTEWTLVDTIAWVKKNSVPFPANKRRLSRIWEFVWVFARKSEIDTFRVNRKEACTGDNGQVYYETKQNIVFCPNNDASTPNLNQATYSSELVKSILDLYCQEGDLVYDPFMGTGTTAVACVEMGMEYIGSELSKNQCDYARDRVENVEKKRRYNRKITDW